MVVSEIDTSTPATPRGSGILTLTATDLIATPGYRRLWFPSVDDDQSPAADLPADGFPSPMGYWIHPNDEKCQHPHAFVLTVRDKPAKTPGAAAPATRAPRAARTLTVGTADTAAGALTLTIGGRSPAEVIASSEAWSQYSEAILLVVAQYTRLGAIEQALAEAYRLFRAQESQSATPNLWRWLRQQPIITGADTFGDIVYDWGHITGLYVDPANYMRFGLSVDVYRSLATGLDIPAWCQRLTETIEEIDHGYDTLLDKLFHYKLFALSMAVEICIVGLIGTLLVH